MSGTSNTYGKESEKKGSKYYFIYEIKELQFET